MQHSFSQNLTPDTMCGKILQDVDRLDALGAIGIARVFATAGAIHRPFYNNDDPFCDLRTPDDIQWTLDHFAQKMLKLEHTMNTTSGREAKRRTILLERYLANLREEL